MVYHMTIAGLERDLPVCKVSDSLAHRCFCHLWGSGAHGGSRPGAPEKRPPYDYLITAEAKGIPLVHEMARQNGDKKYMLARKGPKLYMTGVFDVAVHSITTAKEQHLYLDTADAALMAGKRILIVDDVISTGESLSALEALVEKAGGNIVGRMAILAEGDAQNREDILYLEKLPCSTPTAQ